MTVACLPPSPPDIKPAWDQGPLVWKDMAGGRGALARRCPAPGCRQHARKTSFRHAGWSTRSGSPVRAQASAKAARAASHLPGDPGTRGRARGGPRARTRRSRDSAPASPLRGARGWERPPQATQPAFPPRVRGPAFSGQQASLSLGGKLLSAGRQRPTALPRRPPRGLSGSSDSG